MKYTEFEAKVAGLGMALEIRHERDSIGVLNSTSNTLVKVKKNNTHAISTLFPAWSWYEGSPSALVSLGYELAATPLEEREEPKKYYYYRLPYVACSDGYLNYTADDHVVFYHDKTPSQTYQTQFTREEYAAIAKEHGIPEGVHISEEVTQ